MAKAKIYHYPKQANNWAKAAHDVLNELKKQQEEEYANAAADDWYRCLATSGLVFREIPGDNKKTERFLTRLAEKLQIARDNGIATKDLVEELEKVTGIELEVER